MKICKLQYLISIGMLCVLISGCGSSSDGGTVTTPTTPPIVSNADPVGVWEGTYTEDGVGTFDLTGIVEGDKVIFISDGGEVVYVGTITISGTSFTAMPTVHTRISTVFSTANLSGTVITQSVLSGAFSSSTGEIGSLSLT